MTDDLMRITPLDISSDAMATPGEPPRLEWIEIERLRVNREYQRSMATPRSRAVMRKAAAEFDWATFKALSVKPIDGELYEIIDGQHSATIAATLGIASVPCVISAPGTLEHRAAAFVGANTNRVQMDALALFWAQIAAGDETAGDVLEGATRAGATIPRVNKSSLEYKPGDVIAVRALARIAARGGPVYVERVLSILVEATMEPIGAKWIRAIEVLLWDESCLPRVPRDTLVNTLIGVGLDQIEDMGARVAAGERIPQYRGIAMALLRLCRRASA